MGFVSFTFTIIAEKKDLARDIAKAIPGEIIENKNNLQFEVGEYIICWVGGHILKLKDPEEIDEKYKKWDLKTLPIYFSNWEKKVDSKKKVMFENTKKLVKEADIIINAGDPDDEGQYLVDEVIEFLKCKKKVLRLLVSDNSLEAVKRALANMKDNNNYLSLGYSAKARAIADATLGMTLTRYYTLKKNKNQYKGDTFSVGRVQTPTLALVVNRDYEIENHIKEKYYELFLNLPLENNRAINLKYNSEKILDRSILEKVKNDIENKNGKIKITKNIKLEAPPLPFNLNKLQSEANNRFEYSTDEVMDITQVLRDKYKAITYNRSDCQFLTNEIFKEAPKLVPNLLEKLGINIEVDLSEKNKSKAFKDEVLVHYGIIPTYNPDLKIKNLKIVNLPDVYNVSAFAVLKDKAVIASWDRRVFEVNFGDFTPKELFKTPGVALSAACNDEAGEVIFGLSDGKILNLNQNEIAQIRDESILVIKKIKDITYFGTASGKIYQSDTNIHTIKQNIIFSDRIISFLYDEGSIMALLLNGEIRSVAKR